MEWRRVLLTEWVLWKYRDRNPVEVFVHVWDGIEDALDYEKHLCRFLTSSEIGDRLELLAIKLGQYGYNWFELHEIVSSVYENGTE